LQYSANYIFNLTLNWCALSQSQKNYFKQNFINKIFNFENQSTVFEKRVILILVCFVGYRQDGSTECTRTITDLASACQTLAVLNAKSYYEGFSVAKVIKICSYCSLHFHNTTSH